MEAYDILMIAVLAAATLFGFWKGMAWQIASLASLVLSYFVALQVSPAIAPLFGQEEPWNRFLAMLVIYIVTSLVVWMLFRAVAGAIDRLKLREFDRQLGGLFGLAKGVLLCIAITLFAVSLLPPDKKEEVLNSRSGYYIATLLNESHAIMPEELHDLLHPYLHKAQETLDPDSPQHVEGEHTAAEHRQALIGGAVRQ
jgi:membrane protein required for colicin V production